jgi:heparan-sulfate lyase
MMTTPTDLSRAAQPATDAEIRLLLTRLDLNRPELAAVKAVLIFPERAATALLAYFRERTTVKHPVVRATRLACRGRYTTDAHLQRAAEGVQDVFYCMHAYPPHDFGAGIDWFTNQAPNQDNEWLWQLHRQFWWESLAQAYWHTGDECYAQAWVRQLRDWIRHCPPHQTSPAWRTLEAGIRGYSWCSQFQHFLDSPAVTPRDLVLFLNSCYDHATYLTHERKFSGANWGLMEAEGTAFLALVFPEFTKATEWRDTAIAHLTGEIQRQVRADGHQTEQCLNYHEGCIQWFSRTAELARLNGCADAFAPLFWHRLEAMCEVLMKLGFPDDSSAQFGDTHQPVTWQRQLGKWAEIFNRDDFRFVASHGQTGTPPSPTAFALTESGLYSLRSGWGTDATCLVLKCGPDGGFHCQPDNGTFELYANGRRLMPDSGTYLYHGDADAQAARAWFRLTRVHQTVTLDGMDSAYHPQLRLWQPGDTLDTLVVENASYPGLTHRRAVLFVQNRFFVIIDDAVGAAAGEVAAHFQLLPCTPVIDPAGLLMHTAFAQGTNLLIQGMAQPGVRLAEEEGWVSYIYAQRERRPAICFSQQKGAGTSGVRFVTLLVPFVGATPPPTAIRLLEDPLPGAARVHLVVRVGEMEEMVGYDLATR